MIKRRLLGIFLSLALLTALSFPAALADSGPSGTWALTSYREGNAMITFLDGNSAADWLGIYVEITFQPTGQYQYVEQSADGTYQESGTWQLWGSSLTLTSTDGDTMSMQYQNGVLAYVESDFEMDFVASGTQKLYGPDGSVVASASSSGSSGRFSFFSGGGSGTRASASVAGTHWVATGLSTEMIDWIEFDTGFGGISIGDMMGMITFVSSEQQLTSGFYLAAAYATLDFYADSTFSLTMMVSTFGQMQPNSTETVTGTWSESGGVVTLESQGSPLPCIRSGSTLSVGMSGMAIEFEQR